MEARACVCGRFKVPPKQGEVGWQCCSTLISSSQECRVTREFLRRASGLVNLPEPLSQFVSMECQLAGAQELRTFLHKVPIQQMSSHVGATVRGLAWINCHVPYLWLFMSTRLRSCSSEGHCLARPTVNPIGREGDNDKMQVSPNGSP